MLAAENVVSLMAMLEQARSQGRLEELGAALADWLVRVGESELLGSFEAWIMQVLVERTVPAGKALELRTWNKEEGPMSTLAERVKKWGDELNQQWLEKGLEEGIERERALVRRLAVRRFGPGVVASLGPILDQLSDPDRIAAIADGVLECETADEFIARAREA